MRCRCCGTEIPESSSVCPRCGLHVLADDLAPMDSRGCASQGLVRSAEDPFWATALEPAPAHVPFGPGYQTPVSTFEDNTIPLVGGTYSLRRPRERRRNAIAIALCLVVAIVGILALHADASQLAAPGASSLTALAQLVNP